MDIKTLLDNLHEEVSCSVCMCKFTDPKQLPCLHSFCLHCLNRIQRTSANPDVVACPECRQEFRVPGNGNLQDLSTNFRINSLLDVLAIKECNTSGVKCGNCDKKSEHSFYCFQCCAFRCDDCIGLHNVSVKSKLQYAPPGATPRVFDFFWKLLFKFPPTRAKIPFKCPTLGSIQVIKCPHPGDISQAQKWQKDGGNAFSCRTKSL